MKSLWCERERARENLYRKDFTCGAEEEAGAAKEDNGNKQELKKLISIKIEDKQ